MTAASPPTLPASLLANPCLDRWIKFLPDQTEIGRAHV